MTQTMVLLGAGASVEAGIPTAHGMLAALEGYVVNNIQDDVVWLAGAQLLLKVLATLQCDGTRRHSVSIAPPVDIETLVLTLRALEQSRCSLLDPFADWHPILSPVQSAIGLPVERGRSPDADGGPRQVSADSGAPVSSIALGADLTSAVLAQFETNFARSVTIPEAESAVVSVGLEIVREYLHSVLWAKRDATHYLRPLYHLVELQRGAVVATLNYDTAVDECAGDDSWCETHWATWNGTGDVPTEGAGLTLLKLHGSVDWCEAGAAWFGAQVLRRGFVRTDRDEDVRIRRLYDPYIIFGQENKLLPDGPFLDLLQAYKVALARAQRLVVVGYSFRDIHVNEPIARWLGRGHQHQLIIVDPHFPAEGGDQYSVDLRQQLIAWAPRSEFSIRVLRERASDGLARLEREGIL